MSEVYAEDETLRWLPTRINENLRFGRRGVMAPSFLTLFKNMAACDHVSKPPKADKRN
jgi:hypothetical protein